MDITTLFALGPSGITPASDHWVLALYNNSNQNVYDLVVDSTGKIYIFGTTVVSSYTDLFLAKIDTDGTVLWIKSLKSTSSTVNEIEGGAAVDNADNIYITGNSDLDAILGKFDSNGNLLWSKRNYQATREVVWKDVAISSTNQPWAIGHFENASLKDVANASSYTEDGATHSSRNFSVSAVANTDCRFIKACYKAGVAIYFAGYSNEATNLVPNLLFKWTTNVGAKRYFRYFSSQGNFENLNVADGTLINAYNSKFSSTNALQITNRRVTKVVGSADTTTSKITDAALTDDHFIRAKLYGLANYDWRHALYARATTPSNGLFLYIKKDGFILYSNPGGAALANTSWSLEDGVMVELRVSGTTAKVLANNVEFYSGDAGSVNLTGTPKIAVLHNSASLGDIEWGAASVVESPQEYILIGQPRDIEVDNTGNVLHTVDFIDNNTFVLMKMDNLFNPLWHRHLPETHTAKIASDTSDNVYILGKDAVAGVNLIKYNSSGTIQWIRNISAVGIPGFSPGGIKVVGDFIYLAVHLTVSGRGQDCFLFKLPADGSKTGTYTVASQTFTYAQKLVTEYHGPCPAFNGSVFTNSTGTISTISSGLESISVALTNSKTDIN